MRALAEVGELRRGSSWSEDPLARNLAEIARFMREATRLEAVRGRDYDGLEAELRELAKNKRSGWEHKGSPRTMFGELTRDEVLARRDGVRVDLTAFIAASEADLAPLLHEALQDTIADYERLKADGASAC